jgi:enoyl-CoA hydratase
MTLIIESALDRAVLLTINRPDKLNALNSALLIALGERIQSLASQPAESRPRAVVLTGAGDRAFVAGADIAELSGLGAPEARALAALGHRLGRAIEEAPFPVIAAVNGFALGGGLELALCADFIFASDRAKFGLPEVGLGLIPGFGGTQRLSRRIGAHLYREGDRRRGGARDRDRQPRLFARRALEQGRRDLRRDRREGPARRRRRQGRDPAR